MVDDLLNSGRYMDIYKVLRWAYKINAPIISDRAYDKIEEILKKQYPNDPIFSQSYEDDVEPTELLEEFDIVLLNTIERKTASITNHTTIVDTEPLSQRPIRDKRIAYEWYRQFDGQSICHSLKVDGISTRTLITKNTNTVQQSYSKGRGDTLTDFTTTVSKKIDQGIFSRINTKNCEQILIAAEGIIDKAGVNLVNQMNNTTYKNGRSAALGILATDIPSWLTPHLHLFAFGYNQMTGKYSDSIETLVNFGFEVVPHITTTFVDEGFEKFSSWIDTITSKFKTIENNLDIQADGIVARLNDMALFSQQPIGDLYSDGSIALKFNEFDAKVYPAIVKDIVFEFNGSSSENFTTKLILHPIKTDDNKVINKITGYNLSYIIDKGIEIGSEINVLYQSGCYPMLG